MQLLKVDTLEQAREKLLQAVGDDWLTVCEVPLREARERVLAEDLYGIRDIPEFRRSMVDGYALQAKDTMGAGESIPVFLEVIEDDRDRDNVCDPSGDMCLCTHRRDAPGGCRQLCDGGVL